jgi:hypothetical protein
MPPPITRVSMRELASELVKELSDIEISGRFLEIFLKVVILLRIF